MGPLIGKPGKPGTSPFSVLLSVQLDVEKALDQQLFCEAFRTERSAHASISGWPIRGGGAQ
jgi:hypothetical protein